MSHAEDKVLVDLGRDLERVITEQAPTIIQNILSIANKSGYDSRYLPYLFYVLFERRFDWPKMNQKEKDALSTLVKILTVAGEIPKYRNRLLVPPEGEIDQVLDNVLRKISLWSRTKLAATLLRAYRDLLKKYAPEWSEASPQTPPNKLMGVLKYVFEESLLSRPIHRNSSLLSAVIQKILP